MTLPAQQTADLGSARITYRDRGEGPVMVFLHGLAGNARSWTYQFDAFSERQRVIAWDAPGFGGSDCVPADAVCFSDTLLALMDYLDVKSMMLTGHSMGGIVAGTFAGRHPDRVSALTLSCTHWGGTVPHDAPLGAGYQARVDSLKSIPPQEYGQQRATAMLAHDTPSETIRLTASIAAETRADGLEIAARMLQEADTRNHLAKLTMPVCVVSGEHDPVVRAATSSELAAMIPQSTHVIIPRAGHAPYLEHPVPYNAALRTAFRI